MVQQTLKRKTNEWIKRYIAAEIMGTTGALLAACIAYGNTHSYIAAAAAGWVGEGIGFYSYFITTELLHNAQRNQSDPFYRRVWYAVTKASTNLIVEFAPAEILDNLAIRPFAMYSFPQFIHPYFFGFLVAKFSADAIFYLLAISGYEARRRWL